MNETLQQISRVGIIPVIAIDNADHAIPLAHALIDGGLPAAEVTFRTAAGEEAIRRISREFPHILLGAGTVLDVEQCDRAVAAGARFIVSPGYNPELVEHCLKKGIPVLPGCVSASDLTCAVNAGLDAVKFFPAEPSGGVAFLKSLAPVFPGLSFMPTGGVNVKNLMDYLGYDRIFACGGTWMVKKPLIEGERWQEITEICREAVKTMLGLTLHHVGINCKNEEEASSVAKAFSDLLGLEVRPGRSSIFAGGAVECTKSPLPGWHGHIAIGTNSIDRAIWHLERRGYQFDKSNCKKDDAGRIKSIYFRGEIGGFAVHLVQK